MSSIYEKYAFLIASSLMGVSLVIENDISAFSDNFPYI